MITEGEALRTIEEIGRHARKNECAEAFAQVTVDILARRFGFEYCAVLVKEPNGALSPPALERPDESPSTLEADRAFVRSRLSCPAQGVTGWVAAHGESVRTANVRDDERYYPMREEISSELCVPIRVAAQTLGVVNTESPCRGAYSKRDQDVLEIVALELAAVLQASRLKSPPRAELGAIVTLCSTCKRFHSPQGVWLPIEELLGRALDLSVSHGVCPQCVDQWTG